jgi:hypothetical protein
MNEEKNSQGIPIKAYTVVPQQFSDLIDRLNAYYAPAGIKFLFDVQFDWAPLASTSINTNGPTMRDQCNALAAQQPGKMLCVLRWGAKKDGSQTGNGNAYPPPGAGPKPPSVNDFEQNYVALPSGLSDYGLLNQGNGAWLAHEFGHFLGLYHTFPGWSAESPVYGGLTAPTGAEALAALAEYIEKNGGTADALDGDGLTDTPPDPNPLLWDAHKTNICAKPQFDVEIVLNGTKKTITLAPDGNNLMSYFRGCPTSYAPGMSKMKFSPQQIKRMQDTLKTKNRSALITTPAFGHHALQIGNAFAPAAGRLQVVAADGDERVWLANWDSAKNGGKWDRWRPTLPDNAARDAQIRVVARDPTRLDIFLADANGQVCTGARSQSEAHGQWGGWSSVAGGIVPQGHAVTAVSRFPAQLDVFVAGMDGGVYTAAWNPNANNGQWAGWWRIGTLAAVPGAPVTAVSRGPDDLDIFVAGKDGKIYTTGWSDAASGRRWWPWKAILTGLMNPGGTVSAVSRSPDQLDVFIVGNDGGIYNAVWNKNANKGEWLGWWRIGTQTAPLGSPVTAVARTPDTLDIFVAGNEGKVRTSAWAQNVNQGKWPEWTTVLDGGVRPGSAVAAVARTPNQLDIFAVRLDGALYSAAWDKAAMSGTWKGWSRLL